MNWMSENTSFQKSDADRIDQSPTDPRDYLSPPASSDRFARLKDQYDSA
jgi:hypothetical protein